MKKRFSLVALFLSVVLALTACGSSGSSSSSSDDKTITVGASPTPHAEILEQVKDDLAKEGYELKVVEFTDYVQPNVALNDGELDANYFQHLAYLNDYNKENGTSLASSGTIHYEPLGIYAGKVKSLADLVEGDVVAIPNDVTNEARALLLLEQEGLIKLKDGVGLTATVKDIEENPKGLKFEELEAAQISRSLQDVALGIINGNYAIDAGLSAKDALATEKSDGEASKTYGNVLAVKEENLESEKTKALLKVLQSVKVEDYINEHYDGAVVPLFLDKDQNPVQATND